MAIYVLASSLLDFDQQIDDEALKSCDAVLSFPLYSGCTKRRAGHEICNYQCLVCRCQRPLRVDMTIYRQPYSFQHSHIARNSFREFQRDFTSPFSQSAGSTQVICPWLVINSKGILPGCACPAFITDQQ